MGLWLLAVIAVVMVPLAACIPPEETPPVVQPDPVPADVYVSEVQAEPLTQFEPSIVTPDGSGSGAGETGRPGAETHTRWVAAREPELIAAANQVFDAAVADAWTVVHGFEQIDDSGLFTAVLTKGELTATVYYTTEAAFSVADFDDDVLSLVLSIELDPSITTAEEGQ